MKSKQWIETGSGKLGKLHIEVLACDKLPNTDIITKKTDAFVSLVYEDSMVCTDVIIDRLSPRWMPWTQRAFILRMMHPSSQVFLGVFDYDEIGAKGFTFIGRVSIDGEKHFVV